jgi:predicted GNAT family acetyltransferase
VGTFRVGAGALSGVDGWAAGSGACQTPGATLAPMDVRDNAERSRYELLRDGDVIGFADYERDGDVLRIPYVEIDARMRGNGYASALAAGVLDDARSRNLDVVPLCSFMAWYMRRP